MARLTGGEALVQQLCAEGARVVFGMPGVQMYELTDAIYREPRLRLISVRHEQAAALMAYGYSRSSGDIGVSMVVPGPGIQNASSGIGTAYATSTPIMVISGQVPRKSLGLERGALHEIHDQIEVVRPVTKWAARAMHTGEIPELVNEAYHQMKNGRPRPTEVEVPWDTLAEVEDVELREPARREPMEPSTESLASAADILSKSARPLIWAGSGVASACGSQELTELAELLEAPVVTSSGGKGAISDRHPLSVGAAYYNSDPIHELVRDADVVLAVGTRFRRKHGSAGYRLVNVNVDPTEFDDLPSDAVPVLADARVAMSRLKASIASNTRPSRVEELDSIGTRRREFADASLPQGPYVQAIRSALPEDAVVVAGVNQIGYASESWLPVNGPRSFITSGYSGNLGYAFPTALGAKVGAPDRPVVAISGDGGFLYSSQEMSTAVKYGINAVALVFNDNAYGNVLRDQRDLYDGRSIGAELHNPDFVKLAEAYGVRGQRVRGPEELEKVLARAATAGTPSLIEIPVGMMERPEPRPNLME